MPLSSAQIVTLSTQVAKCPNYTSQAGQLLNSILSDLAQTYDFALARGTFNFNFTPAVAPIGNLNAQVASGPFTLPTDYLRAKKGDVMWFLQQVPYPMIPIDIEEFDTMVQQAGLQSYPYLWATDMSQSPPVAYVWPPASGQYPCMVRYYRQMPDIATPETSATVPWFPNQEYLRIKLAADLMEITDDTRKMEFKRDAENILRMYLTMKDDETNRSKRIGLDRRRFGRRFDVLRDTKTIGW